MARAVRSLGRPEHRDDGTWWEMRGPRGGATLTYVHWAGPGRGLYLGLTGHSKDPRWYFHINDHGTYADEGAARAAADLYVERVNRG